DAERELDDAVHEPPCERTEEAGEPQRARRREPAEAAEGGEPDAAEEGAEGAESEEPLLGEEMEGEAVGGAPERPEPLTQVGGVLVEEERVAAGADAEERVVPGHAERRLPEPEPVLVLDEAAEAPEHAAVEDGGVEPRDHRRQDGGGDEPWRPAHA